MNPKTAATQGILVVATLNVPSAELHELPKSVKNWLCDAVRRDGREATAEELYEYMAAHPMLGVLAGTATGLLERDGDTVRFVRVQVSCGDEGEALALLGRTFGQHIGPIVVHGGRCAPLQFIFARALARGLRIAHDPRQISQSTLDTADMLSPLGAALHPPWHVAADALGLGPWDQPVEQAVIAAAYRRKNRDILGSQLFTMLEAVGSIYVSTFAGRRELQRLPFDGSLLEASIPVSASDPQRKCSTIDPCGDRHDGNEA